MSDSKQASISMTTESVQYVSTFLFFITKIFSDFGFESKIDLRGIKFDESKKPNRNEE